MRITPHLCFGGQCKAAFLNYHQLFGGTLNLLAYGESPMAPDVDSQWHDRIVHATLQFDDVELVGADLLSHDYRKPQGFFVLLTIEDIVKAERIFSSLAVGGEIQVPFQQTFWSAGFGVLVDQFGVPWEINSAQPAASA
ncbi:MAG TPA: VOC family protein [Candidatus Binatia bacterium]|nr:VOC family protein [Candidatus Binatia bacterium]